MTLPEGLHLSSNSNSQINNSAKQQFVIKIIYVQTNFSIWSKNTYLINQPPELINYLHRKARRILTYLPAKIKGCSLPL
jgi:hypothetical protein